MTTQPLRESLYNSFVEVVILYWVSGYNFNIMNKILLKLTPFIFLVYTISPRYTALTFIFLFLPESCKKELTSLSNTTIWSIVLSCFKNIKQYCKHRLLLMRYAVFITRV